jgi:hypothetical protein
MINSTTLRPLATYSVSIPTFAAPPALAKATVYMPSSVAARLIPASLVARSDSRGVERNDMQGTGNELRRAV